eukprot:Gb_23083 [translate_table: standard]
MAMAMAPVSSPPLSIQPNRLRQFDDENTLCDSTRRTNVRLFVDVGPSAIAVKVSTLCKEGRLKEAFTVLHTMNQPESLLDSDTYASLLEACTNMKALSEGNQLHAHMLINGLNHDVFLGTKLINMYAGSGSLENARLVFDKMPKRNGLLWNAMIRGYVRNGFYDEALTLYYLMRVAGIQPDKFTFPCVLNACAGLCAVQRGKKIHDHIIRSGFESDAYVGNALIDMYAKCGSMDYAFQVFDKMSERDVISWTAMIAGNVQNGNAYDALKQFHQMHQVGVKPNPVTIASVLPAYAQLTALRQAKEIHSYIIRNGFESNVFVESALVDMYIKCSTVEFARQVFDKVSKSCVVSWNAMIAGYAQNGYANEALKLFRQMPTASLTPSTSTIVSILPACAHLAILQQGKEIHNFIIRTICGPDVFVETALIHMYSKCGNLQDARRVFDKMSKRDVISWNAIIAAYGVHGYGENAIALFCQMQQSNMTPNWITFIAVLSACSHAGLVDEGWGYFYRMSEEFGIIPSVEHYSCMVDLLGRAGCLDEAQDFIMKMPLQPHAGVWGALLGACRIYHNIELAEHVAEHLLELEPENAGNYVLLSNIYAVAGRWDDVEKLRTMMKNRGLRKNPGCSWIEVNNKVHTFFAGDRSHPESEDIYAMWENLVSQMREEGYVPDTNFVLQDVEDEEKENILCGHSEKLAIAFGLIKGCPEKPIRITKNLRVCGDCHCATKFISKIVRREIIVRDANRFHHFKNGLCSCGDYW